MKPCLPWARACHVLETHHHVQSAVDERGAALAHRRREGLQVVQNQDWWAGDAAMYTPQMQLPNCT